MHHRSAAMWCLSYSVHLFLSVSTLIPHVKKTGFDTQVVHHQCYTLMGVYIFFMFSQCVRQLLIKLHRKFRECRFWGHWIGLGIDCWWFLMFRREISRQNIRNTFQSKQCNPAQHCHKIQPQIVPLHRVNKQTAKVVVVNTNRAFLAS